MEEGGWYRVGGGYETPCFQLLWDATSYPPGCQDAWMRETSWWFGWPNPSEKYVSKSESSPITGFLLKKYETTTPRNHYHGSVRFKCLFSAFSTVKPIGGSNDFYGSGRCKWPLVEAHLLWRQNCSISKRRKHSNGSGVCNFPQCPKRNPGLRDNAMNDAMNMYTPAMFFCLVKGFPF